VLVQFRDEVPGLVNLYGIETPGLTSSTALADKVVRRLTSSAAQ
jgi:L-2-hydroxyglutarate oxidase LhgO